MDNDQYYEFDCGCRFKMLDDKPKDIDGLPPLEVDFYNLRVCPEVWKIFDNGQTKGVFQLESNLGQEWSTKVKPRNIDDLAAIGAIIRPGTLEMEVDGKSMTQHYVDRKHGREPPIPPHPSLENAYKDTYGIGVFQEQSIQVVKDVASFTESESEKFRKAVGKKLVDVMNELHPKFVQGCLNNGLSKEEAELIFEILKKSERYGFNKCLSPETTVELESGDFVTLEEVNVGDKINSPDGFIEVTNKYDNGDQELFIVTLESGKEIECSILHKFLCSDGKIRPLYEIIAEDHSIVTDPSV